MGCFGLWFAIKWPESSIILEAKPTTWALIV